MKGWKKGCLFFALAFLSFQVFSIEAGVVSVEGKVQIKNGNAWADLKPGNSLKKGDVIQTGFKSSAVISISSGNENSRITVAQLSRITFEELTEDSSGDKTDVYLSAGTVKSEIKKTQDHRVNYTVRSPVATASVRGTELTVRNSFLSTDIDTHEGVVSAWKNGKSGRGNSAMRVQKGQSMSCSESSQTTPRDYAVMRTSVLNGSTENAQMNEAVATSSCPEKSYPMRMGGEGFGGVTVNVSLQ